MKAASALIPRATRAQRRCPGAVHCAIAMEQSLAGLNVGWSSAMPTGCLRVGIDLASRSRGASGAATASSTPSSATSRTPPRASRASTTASTTSSASGFACSCPSAPRELLGDAFELVDRGEFMLKGKAIPIRAFEVLGARAGEAVAAS
jgi:class 3 adenylate cyclase